MNDKEIQEYFKKDKSDWYVIDNRGSKKWDDNKVKEFWKTLRKYYKNKKTTIFRSICFPKFETQTFEEEKDYNFFFKEDNKTFLSENISFLDCIFLSYADFSSIKFSGNLFLSKCTFNDDINLCHSTCNKDLIFNHCQFKGEFIFQSATIRNSMVIEFTNFYKNVSFVENNFEKNVFFYLTKFYGNVNFNRTEFNNKCDFMNTDFLGNTSFYHTKFNNDILLNSSNFIGNVEFYQTIINTAIFFNNVSFSNDQKLVFDQFFTLNTDEISFDEFEKASFLVQLYEKEYYYKLIGFKKEEDGSIKLKDFSTFIEGLLNNETLEGYLKVLNNKSKEQRNKIIRSVANNTCFLNNPKIHFYSILFPPNTTFKSCNLSNTSFLKSDISNVKFINCEFRNNNRIILFDELNKNNDLKEIESLYRQLKKSFERELFWDYMNKSYVSEMYIRQKILKKEKKYISWLMYKFYEIFAYYTQDFIRPFSWYIASTFFIFPLFYYANYIYSNSIFSYKKLSSLGWNISHYIQKSFAASLPFISTELTYENWWIKSFQIIFSTILIAFFIFALRRKFRF